MVSHETIKDVLRNWKLENEKLTDVVYDANGKMSEWMLHNFDDMRFE